jgi:hypothetical protein
MLENNGKDDTEFVPLFYLGKWVNVYQYSKAIKITDSLGYKRTTTYQKGINTLDYITSKIEERNPQYVLFYDDKNLEQRVDALKKTFPNLQYETTIEPGYLDKLMYKLNPIGNRNQVIYIYKNGKSEY